jgi:diguanylate cyclase (GGDEF)-like protein
MSESMAAALPPSFPRAVMGAQARSKLLLMTNVQLIGWLVVAVLLALSTVAAVPAGADHTVLFALAGACVVFALALKLSPPSWNLTRASVCAAILVIGVAVAVSQPPGMGRALYLWPMMSAAHFLTRRDTIAALALLAATLLPALIVANPQALELVYAITVIAMGATAALQRAAVEQLQRTLREFEHVANTDSLTGLLDRRGFLAALERDLDRARRSSRPVTLAQFDLDHFKSINDNLGHAPGDKVLLDFGAMLSAECRTTDVAARIGGDEFAVLLFDGDEHAGSALADRVAQRLDEYDAPGGGRLTASAGVAVADPLASAEDLLWAADSAVYDAKAAGRDQIVISRRAQPEPAV